MGEKCGGKCIFWPFLWGKNGVLATFEKQKWADGIPWESKDVAFCGHFPTFFINYLLKNEKNIIIICEKKWPFDQNDKNPPQIE